MNDIVERLNDAIAMAQEPIGYGGTSSEDAYAKFDETALSYVPLMTDTKATITTLREEVERLDLGLGDERDKAMKAALSAISALTDDDTFWRERVINAVVSAIQKGA